MIDMPLTATQMPAECGEGVRTIDDTRDKEKCTEEAYMETKSTSGYERVQNDWYVEPESVTTRLLAEERPFIGRVLDPCCGQGNVVRAMRDAGLEEADGCDIVPRLPGALGGCFTQTLPGLMPDSVISNPPYNRAQEVAQVALDCTQDRVCLFLRLAFLEGQRRSVWLKNSPLARVWVLPDRVACVPGHMLGQTHKKFSGSVAYAWFVWEHGYHGRPEIGWLPQEAGHGE